MHINPRDETPSTAFLFYNRKHLVFRFSLAEFNGIKRILIGRYYENLKKEKLWHFAKRKGRLHHRWNL